MSYRLIFLIGLFIILAMEKEIFASNPLIGPDGKDYLSGKALLQARQEWNSQHLVKLRKYQTVHLVYPQTLAQEIAELFLILRRAVGQFPTNKLVRTLEEQETR